MNIPAIAFVGKQNSGKTVLLEKLIAALSADDIKVGTLKHHSHAGFNFDVEGKDSWRHAQAGSRFSVINAPDKIAMVRLLDAPLPADETIAAMIALSVADTNTQRLDIILVEGYRHAGLPTIELFRAANPNDAERELGSEDNDVIAVITDIERIVAAAAAASPPLPCFGFDDIDELAGFLKGIIR
ncbi:MAG: molybdopterin-guanine dinucleotide biosynthesis protein B [Coriobacteriales bacterium]|jgi:molybdopterin-guanine dinucleotide biosynthesis protein MobB|nr:molybdopterin-guanine dinucleotide biosynthesis protein B [Coriobacteriales bacterium]